MVPYEVSWMIEVDGESPVDAAVQAWEILRDTLNGPGIASVLQVRDPGGLLVNLDMDVDPPAKIGS